MTVKRRGVGKKRGVLWGGPYWKGTREVGPRKKPPGVWLEVIKQRPIAGGKKKSERYYNSEAGQNWLIHGRGRL